MSLSIKSSDTRLLVFAVLLISVVCALAFLPESVGAQEPTPSDDEVNAIAHQLFCPVCENTPLDVCPTQACKDWRELIRQQLSDGWSEQQVLDYFAATYGPQVLAQPPINGFSALVWILPVIGLTGGGIFLWRLLRRWQARPSSPPEPTAVETTANTVDIAPELLARIEQEVETRF